MRPIPILSVLPLAFSFAACDADDPAAETQAAVVEAEQTGSEIYAAYCATCHGADGDGRGPAMLDRPARSFRDGGFSFGNTPEALFRTVANGIGGTPMPGFSTALSDEAIRRVVEHVIAFGPERVPEAGKEAILTVADRPVVVRGQFRSVAEGQPAIPRGLMVGTLDGLSWLYDADDVRLLQVRQGAFVNRTDWKGRGGTPLEPLGQVIDTLGGGASPARFRVDGNALAARLRSTRIDGDRAWVRYDLLRDGSRLASVRERGAACSTRTAAGYERTFEFGRVGAALELFVTAPDVAGEIRGADGTVWMASRAGDRWQVYGARIDGAETPSWEAGEGGIVLRLPRTDTLTLSLRTLLLPDAEAATWQNLQEDLR